MLGHLYICCAGMVSGARIGPSFRCLKAVITPWGVGLSKLPIGWFLAVVSKAPARPFALCVTPEPVRLPVQPRRQIDSVSAVDQVDSRVSEST